MKSNIKFALTILLVILAGIGLQLLFTSHEEEPKDTNQSHVRKSVKRRGADHAKRSRNSKLAGNKTRASLADKEVSRIRERPNLDDLDESELSKLQKAVLRELQAALDDNDLVRARKVIAKFHAPKSEGGLAGEVPKVMRRQAIGTLRWFGGGAIGDMVEFMADVDPEIEEEAFASFEAAIEDWDVSDRDRSSILLTVMKSLHNGERINSLLMALNNMRNSVRGETITGILNSGTAEAREMMQEQVELYTDLDVKTVEDVGKWIKENPDNEWDEEFYGAAK